MLDKRSVVSLSVTYPNQESADSCSAYLLESRLAACVQQTQGLSSFIWKGEIVGEQEIVLSIKTLKDRIPLIDRYLAQNHPYDVYQRLVVEFADVNSSYYDWICEAVPQDD